MTKHVAVEIKYPYSINYTEPNKQNLEYLYKKEDEVKLKESQTDLALF